MPFICQQHSSLRLWRWRTSRQAVCTIIFRSKNERTMYVMDQVMDRLSQRIEAVTNGFTDPAQVYAFGIRNVMIAATTDQRWRWVLVARKPSPARCIA